MKHTLSVAVSLLALSPIASRAQVVPAGAQPGNDHHLTNISKTTSPALAPSFGKLPLSFEANQGQTDSRVRFFSRGQGYSLFLTDSEAVLSLARESSVAPVKGNSALSLQTDADVIRMKLAGASPAARVTGSDPLPGKANYFIGNDPKKWHSNVPTYERVQYTGVYPGVDLAFYGNQRQLEYDFVLAPGADAEPVRLQFGGVDKLRLEANGDLNVADKYGAVTFHKPVIYQMQDGRRKIVEGGFKIVARNTVGFRLGSYDHTGELVIDPVVAYSTYLGSGGTDIITNVAVDQFGDAYVAGTTTSAHFPVHHPLQTAGYTFLAKLNAAGDQLLYATYFGDNTTRATFIASISGIAVDSEQNAYLTGSASVADFPTTPGAYQTTETSLPAAFVTKINSTGSALVYSTFLGHNSSGDAIAVDRFGDAFVAGSSSAKHFPVTAGAYQTSFTAPSDSDFSMAFVSMLDPTGSTLVHSTYLGPATLCNGNDVLPFSIHVDYPGNIYVGGGIDNSGCSAPFPTTSGAYQTSLPSNDVPGFVTKFNPALSALVYSTLFPAVHFVFDDDGKAYGYTGGSGPTPGKTPPNSIYGWVGKLNASGTALEWGTDIGDSHDDRLNDIYGYLTGIAVDPEGDLFVTGSIDGNVFPVTPDAFQSTYSGLSSRLTPNAFLAVLSADGSSITYGTYLGGHGDGTSTNSINGDIPYAIALDALHNAYIVGGTASHDFPVTPGTLQLTNHSPTSATGFITKFAFNGATTTTLSTADTTVVEGANVTLTTVTEAIGGNNATGPPTGSVTFFVDGKTAAKSPVESSGSATFTTDSLSVGRHMIAASYDGHMPIYSASASAPVIVTITSAP